MLEVDTAQDPHILILVGPGIPEPETVSWAFELMVHVGSPPQRLHQAPWGGAEKEVSFYP